MDEAGTAATAVALVVPYLAEGAKELARKVGGEAGQRVVKLWDAVRGKLAGKEALADVEAKPDDPRRWQALEVQLKKALAADPGFRGDVARLIEAIPAEQRMAIQQIAKVTGERNVTAQVAGSGNWLDLGSGS
jgi:GNAT superfamily N-acetyltransferase